MATEQKSKKPRAHAGGMPEGHKTAKTIEKEAARTLLRNMVIERLQPLVDAQMANAMGLKYMVLRDKKTGKFVRLGKDALEKLVAQDAESMEQVEIWEKDPNVTAFTDLLNRAIDKPIEPVEVAVSGNLELSLTERLAAGRKRIAAHKR
jgi:hypothetical protein